jgi:hypothetical protein
LALISFEEALKSPPAGSLFVADTSFIINSLVKNQPEFDVRNKLAGKIGFVYNVVIRKEILHFTRYQMMADAIENGRVAIHKRVKYLWDNTQDHNRLKALCDEGYASLFREVFGANGEKLEKEIETALTGFVYGDSKKNSNASRWDRVYALMAIYGLDSSDAMILNFAAGDATYSGIITSDGDFRVCGDVQSKNKFDIILPKAAKSRVAVKEWRPNP